MGSLKLADMETDPLTSRLKEVFEIVDDQKKGYISADHFLQLAKEFTSSNSQISNSQAIERMVSMLDTDGTGQISLETFCEGVKEILKSNNTSLEQNDKNQTAIIDDFLTVRRFSNDGSKSPEVYETTELLDLETNLPNNNAHPANPSQKSAGSSLEDDADSGAWGPWLNSAEKNPAIKIIPTTSTINDSSYQNNSLLDNDFEPDDRNAIYFTRKNTATPLSTPRSSIRSNNTTRISAPVSRTGSFRKSVTPSSIASQLYRNGSANNCSDLLMDDSQVYELTDKITQLEEKLTDLSETQKKNEDKQMKMKEENMFLVERVHMLEEMLKDMESTNEERFREEQRKNKELLVKTEKDKSNQIDLLEQSLKIVQTEYNQLKIEVPALRSENEQLKRQNFNLEREMAKIRQEYSEVSDEKINLQESLHSEQQKMTRERQAHSQLLDQLTQELNELRLCKSNLMKLSPANQRRGQELDDLPMTLKVELETQIRQLKQDNMNLKYQLEELQALILNKHVEEGMNLLEERDRSFNTLANELQDVPRTELMQALHKEQEANRKLKEYIEFITLRILDSNPGILEIGRKQK